MIDSSLPMINENVFIEISCLEMKKASTEYSIEHVNVLFFCNFQGTFIIIDFYINIVGISFYGNHP